MRLRPLLFPILSVVCLPAATPPALLEHIKLPPGFVITLYADHVDGARSLAQGKNGTVFLGTRGPGKVYALPDRNRDQRPDTVITLARDLHSPNGVAFRDGALYVAEINRILRFPNIEERLAQSPAPQVVYDRLPKDRHHGWKFIRFGPDGKLYVPVGAPCNICLEDPQRYAAIFRMNPDGSGFELYAQGVRNTVGFDWHPQTKTLWFTDNGRDWLGDDRPPDELNHASRPGMDFGFPFCHGKNIADPQYGKKRPCSASTPPALELDPHVASLGMRFYTGTMFPEKYRNGIFIAEHGSWNRSTPLGYRIMFVRLQGDQPVSYEVFAEGWLQDGHVWGRPVDVEVMPDGALLVSDDHAGAIYRISYRGN